MNRSVEDFNSIMEDYWIPPRYKQELFEYFTEFEQKRYLILKKVNGLVIEWDVTTINKSLLRRVMNDLSNEEVMGYAYGFPLSRLKLYSIMKDIMNNPAAIYRY